MFIFLTVTLFFQFKYRQFTSRKMRVILNERALEPAFLAAGQCTCALVFQPCPGNMDLFLTVDSTVQKDTQLFSPFKFRFLNVVT